jgi:hypothetical protein
MYTYLCQQSSQFTFLKLNYENMHSCKYNK